MIFGSAAAGDALAGMIAFVDGVSSTFPLTGRDMAASKVTVPMNGLGNGSGDVKVVAQLKDDFTDVVVAESAPVTIVDGQGFGLVDFAFAGAPIWTWDGLHLNATVTLSLEEGDPDSALVGDIGGDQLAVTATMFVPYLPPAGQDDFYLARLPFAEAQAAIGVNGGRPTPPGTAMFTNIGWHGTAVDRDRGSFAIVRLGGPYEELLGQRIRITAPGGRRRVYAFVSSTAPVAQDITVTRRLFQQLASLGTRELHATVEMIARA